MAAGSVEAEAIDVEGDLGKRTKSEERSLRFGQDDREGGGQGRRGRRRRIGRFRFRV